MDARFQFHFSKSIHPADAVAKALQVYAALSQLPEVQEPLPPLTSTLEQLKAAAERLQEATTATSAGDRTKIPQRESALDEVVNNLNRVGTHMQLVAWDKAHLLHNAGFDLVRTRTSVGPLTAPINFTVKNDSLPGMVVARVSTVRGAVSYEVWLTDGDPTVEENWTRQEIFGRTKMEITGLEQGKKYSFRVRAIGKDHRGPWSSCVTMIVT